MATPSAAGASLLVRDYFSSPSRAFWTGACNPNYPFCRAFLPSGVLVKAVLINSGSPQTLFHGGGTKDVKLGEMCQFFICCCVFAIFSETLKTSIFHFYDVCL